MAPLDITGPARLVLGLATGVVFGFILQKAQVSRQDKIVGFLRWTDLTVFKVMLTAVLTGMVAVYAMHELGLAKLHIKPTLLGANVAGGLIFGVGMLLLGFCPGTCAAAVGEGRMDGLLRGIVGILLGAALYSEAHPYLMDGFLKLGDLGKLTIPSALGLNPWLVIVPVAAAGAALLAWLESRER